MGKENILIDKSMVKTVVDGKIMIPLPKVLVGNQYYRMFSISSPTHCDDCSSKLNVNSHYTRFLLSSYGTIARDVTYWFCPAKPVTNNTMEQTFSLIRDIIENVRSFKTGCGLANFCYNLFTYFNNRYFATGKWRGFSPLMRAKFLYGSG